MKEYERLTINEIRLDDDSCAKEFYICGVTIYDLYNRLAELEDKIENGTFVELNKPYIKQQSNGLYIVCKAQEIGITMGVKSKAEAENKLKELKE